MSSAIQVEPAPTKPRASELQTCLARPPAVVVGALISLLGLILTGGGAYLAVLGGSWYYILAGALFLASGYLMIRGRIAGLYTYVGAFSFTTLWTFWEVGLSGWQLIPRLVGPFIFLVLAILVAPALDQVTGRRVRKLGLAGVGIFAAALAILIPIFNQQAAPLPLPEARAEAFFADPAYSPKKGEWDAYGGGQGAQRYSELN